jgi:hypothetical protein
MDEQEIILLKKIVHVVSTLSMGESLPTRLTKAYAEYAKYKEEKDGKEWHRKLWLEIKGK